MQSDNQRRTATIMFTDIAGYTAMMQKDETDGLKKRNRFREVLQKHHNSYHGEIIKHLGDVALSVFKNSLNAVRCAVEIMKDLKSPVEVPVRIDLMRTLFLLSIIAFISGCSQKSPDREAEIINIDSTLNSWHAAAAKADYKMYFNLIAEDGVFIGTDATENWNKKDFMVWAKPYFDKGKAWSFTSLERHIYFDKSNELAWFDELLNTQMKICRGSGVLVKEHGEWKIKQYVLSMTIPNSKMDTIVNMKSAIEDELLKSFK